MSRIREAIFVIVVRRDPELLIFRMFQHERNVRRRVEVWNQLDVVPQTVIRELLILSGVSAHGSTMARAPRY